MNELMPWGLTLAQSLFLGIGFFLIIFGWVILKGVFKVAGSALVILIALLMGCLFCGLVGFYLSN